MLLSDSAIPLTRESVRRLIGIAWPLFAAFYPQEPIQKRNATLARSMRTAGVVEACEFLKIQGLTDADRALPCAGALEGAHIDAHAEGVRTVQATGYGFVTSTTRSPKGDWWAAGASRRLRSGFRASGPGRTSKCVVIRTGDLRHRIRDQSAGLFREASPWNNATTQTRRSVRRRPRSCCSHRRGVHQHSTSRSTPSTIKHVRRMRHSLTL